MSNLSHGQAAPANHKGWSTRKLVTLALFTALALILSFIEAPIFPAATFLKYDASNVVLLLAAFAYGPAAGCIVAIVSAAIHGLIMGDPWGSLMMMIVAVCWVVPAALIYRAKPTRAVALVGLVVAAIISIAGAIVGNLLITPIYTGTDVPAVIAMIVPILLPFNALKAVINVVLSFVLYAPVQQIALQGQPA